MPGISVTDVYDAVLSSTLRNYRKMLVDNIFNKTELLKWLRMAGRFQFEDGGYQIVEQLLYGKNDTVKAYSSFEQLPTTPQDGITSAIYDWKEYGGTITISRKEARQNAQKHQILGLLKAKTKQTELTIRDTINTDLFANVSTEPAKKITNLILAASDTPSTTTIGQISGATYSWWRNQAADVGSYGSNLLPKMRTMHNDVSKAGAGRVSGICCTQTGFERYEALADTYQRFGPVKSEKRSLDMGFEILQFKGADLFWDSAFASGTPVTGESMIFFVDEAVRLVIDKESDFITTDFIEPENQTAKVAKVVAMLNFTVNNRRALGLLHGIDA